QPHAARPDAERLHLPGRQEPQPHRLRGRLQADLRPCPRHGPLVHLRPGALGRREGRRLQRRPREHELHQGRGRSQGAGAHRLLPPLRRGRQRRRPAQLRGLLREDPRQGVRDHHRPRPRHLRAGPRRPAHLVPEPVRERL
ncbi:hypothetical protein HK102_012826, partial [Quaeritorhiza haematococci]